MAQENNFHIEDFDPEVLREYDIRGVVDKTITENTAYTIGRVFSHVVFSKLNSNNIAIAPEICGEAIEVPVLLDINEL